MSTAAIGTLTAIAGVVAPFVIRWLDRRSPVQPAGLTRDAQHRTVMLRRVRYKWITGVLEPSLANAARLVLGLERRSDVLELGARTVRRSGRPPEPLSGATPISEVLDTVGGGLLILGAPGSGKTTTLLQLCDELLDRAEHDVNQPLPVVVNMASWARSRLPLGAWLVDELITSYQVPRSIATEWVEQDALAPLLDGLDEVAEAYRAMCADAVNAFRREHGLVPLVLCSRTQELKALGARLRLDEAVELQPPSDAEVDRYLGYLEATGTPIADVRLALASDQELRQLLRSPLLLHVVALAYHGRSPSALFLPGTTRQRQEWLWEAYIVRMLEQRPLDPGCGYTDELALGWLTWLAQALRDRDETEFHLDRLAPEWLPTPDQQRRARLMTGLVEGLVAGPPVAVAFSLVAVAVGLRFGLVDGLVAGLAFGLVGGLAFGHFGRRTATLRPAEQASWSWRTLRRGAIIGPRYKRASPNKGNGRSAKNAPVAVALGLAAGLSAALVGGLIGGLTFGLVTGLVVGMTAGLTGGLVGGRTVTVEPAEQVGWSWTKLRAGMARTLAAGLTAGLTAGLVGWLSGELSTGLAIAPGFGLSVALVGGLTSGLVGGLRDERAMPNEGIRRSAQHALVVGLAGWLAFGLAGGLTAGLTRGPATGLTTGLGLGLAFAMAVGLVFGGLACLQHYVVRYGWCAKRQLLGNTGPSWKRWLNGSCCAAAEAPTCSSTGCSETTLPIPTLTVPRRQREAQPRLHAPVGAITCCCGVHAVSSASAVAGRVRRILGFLLRWRHAGYLDARAAELRLDAVGCPQQREPSLTAKTR